MEGEMATIREDWSSALAAAMRDNDLPATIEIVCNIVIAKGRAENENKKLRVQLDAVTADLDEANARIVQMTARIVQMTARIESALVYFDETIEVTSSSGDLQSLKSERE